MKIAYRAIALVSLSGLLLLAACSNSSSGGSGSAASPYGNSGGGTPLPGPVGYVVNYLVADTAAVQKTYGALNVDPNLVNPWGIVFTGGPVWLSNEGTSTSTLYDGTGLLSRVVTIAKGSKGIGAPTGIVGNSGTGFILSNGTKASFIYSTIGGTIVGYNAGTNPGTVVAYDGGASGASYMGLAIGTDSGGNYYLYAANFSQAKVDVFNGAFTKVTPAGAFTDAAIPAGYAPYGIQNIPTSSGATQIYVTYAQQNAAKTAAVTGAGLGYVAVFDSGGTLISTLISGGVLNAPWGIALANAQFGPFGSDLLVGNFGDGKINAYNPTTGALLGPLTAPSGSTVVIPGLWGIQFGDGVSSQPTSTLFFAAGVNGQADGVYGRIDYAVAGYNTTGGGF